jgi:hypothetical protein
MYRNETGLATSCLDVSEFIEIGDTFSQDVPLRRSLKELFMENCAGPKIFAIRNVWGYITQSLAAWDAIAVPGVFDTAGRAESS